MKTAAIYCRISRDPGNDELGVRRQEADCRKMCEAQGIEVVDVLIDDDVSGYTRKRRAGYERLLELLDSGAINTVVAWHPDRLTRHPRELEDLIDALERAKATVRTVQAGDYDLSTPAGRMTARVVGAVARGESEHKAARLRRKHEELAERGKVSGGGTRPYGFNDDRVTIRKAEAKIITEAARRVLAGDTLRSIVADLNRRGVSTVTGRPWTQVVLRNMLTSGRNAGLREHRSGTFRAEWPAIIGEDDHRRLVAIFNDPSRRSSTRSRRYLLTGLAVCGLCGAKLVARPRADKRTAVVCATGPSFSGCGKIRALTDPLDELVTEAVLTRLDGIDLDRLVVQVDGDDTDDVDALRRLEAKLGELGEMWAAGDIDRAGWTSARQRLEAEREAVSGRVRQRSTPDALAPYAGRGGALRAAWPELAIDQRRAVIAAVVESVVIGPAVRGRNYFDPSRVSIVWKG